MPSLNKVLHEKLYFKNIMAKFFYIFLVYLRVGKLVKKIPFK